MHHGMLHTRVITKKDAGKFRDLIDEFSKEAKEKDEVFGKMVAPFSRPEGTEFNILLIKDFTNPETGKKEQKMIGFSQVKPYLKNRYSRLNWTYVLPEERGRMVGALLENKTYAALKEKGFKNMSYSSTFTGLRLEPRRSFLWLEGESTANSRINSYFSARAPEKKLNLRRADKILKKEKLKSLLIMEGSPQAAAYPGF